MHTINNINRNKPVVLFSFNTNNITNQNVQNVKPELMCIQPNINQPLIR